MNRPRAGQAIRFRCIAGLNRFARPKWRTLSGVVTDADYRRRFPLVVKNETGLYLVRERPGGNYAYLEE